MNKRTREQEGSRERRRRRKRRNKRVFADSLNRSTCLWSYTQKEEKRMKETINEQYRNRERKEKKEEHT
jgi:hypothetical protein